MDSKKKSIAICLGDSRAYSETFIQSHVDRLKSKLFYLSEFPKSDLDNNKYIKRPENLFFTFIYFIKKIFSSFENKNKLNKISRKIKRESIGIVLAEYGHVGAAILDVLKKNNVPLVVHFHGFDAYKKEHLISYEKKYQEMFEYASAIIVVSSDMKKQLIKIGANESKIVYNLYGVNLDQFKKADVLNSPQDLLFVGRFVEKKAPYLAILAFEKVLKEVPNAKFHMVGDGMMLDMCKNIVKSLKLSDNVIFYGALPHSEISKIMLVSRAYIQHSIIPSNGDSEGTPNSVLEAMTSGLPVISTRHGGIQDVVENGKTGFLVEEGDIDLMAKYMIDVLLAPKLAASLGNAANRFAIENFSIDKSINNLESILRKNILV